jgi:cytoskeletal protein CcmA (bactofilin family)
MMRHYEELDFLRYLDGETPVSRTAEIEAHLDGCRACRELLSALEQETVALREALQEADEALPARFRSAAPEDLSWVFLGVLGLAATGLYTLWNWILLPWWEGLQSVGVDHETLLTVLLFKAALWEGWSTMGQNLIRGAAVILSTLAIVSLARWSWRRAKPLSAMLALLLWALAPGEAGAAVIEHKVDNYTLSRDQIIENDLIVAADTVRIEGTIEGDLIAVAQMVTVTGHIKGDVLAFCQSLQVDGQVDGSVRSGSEFLNLNGRVGRNVTSGAKNVELTSDAVVNGSLTLGAAQVNLEGRTGRDIIVAAHQNTVNARIGGGALLAGEKLTIGPAAEIPGEVSFYGAEEPQVSPEARLTHPLKIEILKETPRHKKPETYVMPVLKWAAAFIFGLVPLLLVPRAYDVVVQRTARYGISILVGVAALVVIPVVSLIVCATLVGIPLGLASLFVFAAGAYGGQIFVGSWLGREILGQATNQGQALGQLALGLGFIYLVGELPYVGALISWVVVFWGLGALVLTLFDRSRPASATV